MIFQHTWQKVLDGTKTQTRRIVRDGENFFDNGREFPRNHNAVENQHGRIVYGVNRTYAMQPGRGKAAAARIRITAIRCEDVRKISHPDVLAEGYTDWWEFMETWIAMHDKAAYRSWIPAFEYVNDPGNYHPDFAPTFEGRMRGIVKDRPAKFYTAWALTFEVVR